ncbi:MAG: FMN-binding glutamate synthase family protein, partial [Euryarchaeota archaeon]|nr:FMN-binding glutamate synthase family protein [Euryarchaeota archaeon]
MTEKDDLPTEGVDYRLPDRFKPDVDYSICKNCKRCIKECSYRALEHRDGKVRYMGGCVACGRCIVMCPESAIEVRLLPYHFPPHANFTERIRRGIISQANTGGVLLSSCGTDLQYPVIFDELLLDAAQVTNPSIDPLREPIETTTLLGRRGGRLTVSQKEGIVAEEDISPILAMDMPIMIGHVSLGAVSYPAQKALFMSASELNIIAGSGEGG